MDLESLAAEVTILRNEVNELKTTTAVTKEQTKMVFNMLTEIKDSIRIIANKLDMLEGKPGQRWEESIKTVLVVIITSAVAYFITKK